MQKMEEVQHVDQELLFLQKYNWVQPRFLVGFVLLDL